MTGMGRRVGRALVRLGSRPRWSAHPFGGTECRGHARFPAFAPGFASGVAGWVLWCLVVQHVPQIHRHAVPNPLQFLCLLLLEEVCFQV